MHAKLAFIHLSVFVFVQCFFDGENLQTRNDETISIHSHDGHLTVMLTSIRYDPKSKRD